jgi:N,N'-diacetylchitobiose transport system permease protein
LALLSTIWTMGEFESIWILTRGGPGDATELVTVYAFRHAFLGQDLAFGAAAYVCLLPVMSCVLLLFFWLYRRATERGYL